ncbi:MAG: FlgD immunoglobulin-like domain containing protein [Candidatus Eisenbacteria bacterium]
MHTVSGLWSGAEAVSASGGFTLSPALAVSPTGAPHIAWADGRHGAYEIYYAAKNGSVWVEERLTTHGAGAQCPAIALDAAGEPHLAWEDRRQVPGTSKIYYKKRVGGVWQADQQLTFEEMTESREPTLAIDAMGDVHVAWTDRRVDFGDIYYRRCVSGTWMPEESLQALETTARNAAICCDRAGQVHLAWADNTPGNYAVFYMLRNEVGWSVPERLSGGFGPADDPAIATDQTGSVHVAWEDDRKGVPTVYYMQREAHPAALPDSHPTIYADLRCTPNPFQARTVILLARESETGLHIYSADGRRVRILPGSARGTSIEYTWDGSDDAGHRLPTGAYFYKVGDGRTASGKVILAR